MLLVKFIAFLFCIGLITPICATEQQRLAPTPIETTTTDARQSWLVHYPGLESGEVNPGDLYKLKILELAFAEMNQPLQLQPVNSSGVLESRDSRNLIEGRYDVHWLPSEQTPLTDTPLWFNINDLQTLNATSLD